MLPVQSRRVYDDEGGVATLVSLRCWRCGLALRLAGHLGHLTTEFIAFLVAGAAASVAVLLLGRCQWNRYDRPALGVRWTCTYHLMCPRIGIAMGMSLSCQLERSQSILNCASVGREPSALGILVAADSTPLRLSGFGRYHLAV